MGFKIGTLKLLIIVPNVIFFIAGFYIVYKGTEGIIEYKKWPNEQKLGETKTKASFGVALAAGLLQCMLSFIAICGALADKHGMLKTYALIVIFEIVFHITAAIIIFIASDTLEGHTYKRLGMATIMKEFSIGLIVFVCIDTISALAACFLAEKLKEDYSVSA